jgi:hypothetical protein
MDRAGKGGNLRTILRTIMATLFEIARRSCLSTTSLSTTAIQLIDH